MDQSVQRCLAAQIVDHVYCSHHSESGENIIMPVRGISDTGELLIHPIRADITDESGQRSQACVTAAGVPTSLSNRVQVFCKNSLVQEVDSVTQKIHIGIDADITDHNHLRVDRAHCDNF